LTGEEYLSKTSGSKLRPIASSFHRGYLAKGVFLKERGRRADAERMFLQARFYAPQNLQAYVATKAGNNPVLELPDNGLE